MKRFVMAAAMLLAVALPAAANDTEQTKMAQAAEPPCNTVLSPDEVAELVDQCMQVSPATHPPCNGENSCEMITDEIQRGCGMLSGKDKPAFCSNYEE